MDLFQIFELLNNLNFALGMFGYGVVINEIV